MRKPSLGPSDGSGSATLRAMRIYLDHNATTPLRPEVRDAMLRVLDEIHGNPSSVHAEGAAAHALIEGARDRVAEAIGIRSWGPSERLVFTAGASEANNALLRGGPWARRGARIVATNVEHPSVQAPLEVLAAEGVRVERIGVDAEGMLPEGGLEEVLREPPDLVTLIWGNNETGTLLPLAGIAERIRDAGVWLHVDATQVLGKYPVDLRDVPVDSLSLSAHKLNGPKGVGALYLRDARRVAPWLLGGGQERGLRGGTENVPGIAGFGMACELVQKEGDARVSAYAALRDRLWHGIEARIEGVRRNGPADAVLCNTLNVEFEGVAGEVLLQALDLEGVAVSAGAACHSGKVSASHVLLAMGRSVHEAGSCLRFSVGYGVDATQIDRVLEWLDELVQRARRAVGA